jgi:uncharacterized protein (TIGR02594 family)
MKKIYEIANKELGIKEIKGRLHSNRILEYHSTTTLKATDDETPWCSSFVNWCVQLAELKGTNSAAARSWLKWGNEVKEPYEGCVVVIKRGNSSWQGHVGFFVKEVGNNILILGGNQSNAVTVSSYSKERVLGYRDMYDPKEEVIKETCEPVEEKVVKEISFITKIKNLFHSLVQ